MEKVINGYGKINTGLLWEEGCTVAVSGGDPRFSNKVELKKVRYCGHYYEENHLTKEVKKSEGLYLLLRGVDGSEDWYNLSRNKVRRSIHNIDPSLLKFLPLFD